MKTHTTLPPLENALKSKKVEYVSSESHSVLHSRRGSVSSNASTDFNSFINMYRGNADSASASQISLSLPHKSTLVQAGVQASTSARPVDQLLEVLGLSSESEVAPTVKQRTRIVSDPKSLTKQSSVDFASSMDVIEPSKSLKSQSDESRSLEMRGKSTQDISAHERGSALNTSSSNVSLNDGSSRQKKGSYTKLPPNRSAIVKPGAANKSDTKLPGLPNTSAEILPGLKHDNSSRTFSDRGSEEVVESSSASMFSRNNSEIFIEQEPSKSTEIYSGTRSRARTSSAKSSELSPLSPSDAGEDAAHDFKSKANHSYKRSLVRLKKSASNTVSDSDNEEAKTENGHKLDTLKPVTKLEETKTDAILSSLNEATSHVMHDGSHFSVLPSLIEMSPAPNMKMSIPESNNEKQEQQHHWNLNSVSHPAEIHSTLKQASLTPLKDVFSPQSPFTSHHTPKIRSQMPVDMSPNSHLRVSDTDTSRPHTREDRPHTRDGRPHSKELNEMRSPQPSHGFEFDFMSFQIPSIIRAEAVTPSLFQKSPPKNESIVKSPELRKADLITVPPSSESIEQHQPVPIPVPQPSKPKVKKLKKQTSQSAISRPRQSTVSSATNIDKPVLDKETTSVSIKNLSQVRLKEAKIKKTQSLHQIPAPAPPPESDVAETEPESEAETENTETKLEVLDFEFDVLQEKDSRKKQYRLYTQFNEDFTLMDKRTRMRLYLKLEPMDSKELTRIIIRYTKFVDQFNLDPIQETIFSGIGTVLNQESFTDYSIACTLRDVVSKLNRTDYLKFKTRFAHLYHIAQESMAPDFMERLSQICGPILMKKFGFQLFSDADPTEDVQFIGRLWRGKKKIKEEQTPAEVFNALFVGHLPPGCMTAATYLTFITLAYYDVVFGMRASEIASTSEELLNSIYRFDLQI